MEVFEESLQRWLKQAQAIIDTAWASNGYTHAKPPTLTLDRSGTKNIRVVRMAGAMRSVHCFIDIATGDVLKAASWKAPAKGARGSIYDETRPGVTEYGGIYKR